MGCKKSVRRDDKFELFDQTDLGLGIRHFRL